MTIDYALTNLFKKYTLKTIFITIPWFHPAFKAGGPVQSIANMVNELSEGYRFYIFCGNEDLDGLPLHLTHTNAWVPYNAHTKVWYATRQERSQRLEREIKNIKPDILYMVGIYSWHFTMVPLFFTKVPVKILSVRGMLHPGALGEKALKKKVFLRGMKWMKLARRCIFHVTDELESGHVRALLGEDIKIFEAGNFPRRMERLALPVKEAGSLRLISIALISPMKNILLVLQGLQQCRQQVLYDIYGPVKEIAYWEECLEQIRHLPENITVQYHKEVEPVQVANKLAHAHVFILPSKSENFGHSIYEALAAGLPVITSDFTPWNKLEESNAGVNVQLNAEAVAISIENFGAMNQEAFRLCSEAAAEYAGRQLNREALIACYGTMFSSSTTIPG